MIKKYCIENSKVCECAADKGDIFVFTNPDEKERANITANLGIDEHTINSALDPEELSRLEIETDYTAVIFKRPKNYSGENKLLFKVASMGMFIYKDKLVIIVSEDIPLFHGKKFQKADSLWDVLLKIIYSSIYHYIEHLRVITMISEELEKKLSTSVENKYLLNLFSLEKSLVYYSNAISSNGFVFEKLKNHWTRQNFPENAIDTLEDIIVENSQCLRQADIYSNILASLMDARASIVSNNLNFLMKTLNLITIGIMIPTFVVSAFSMNVAIPFQKHPHAFWIVMGFVALSIIVSIRYWKYKKW